MGAATAYSAYRRSEVETLNPRNLLVKLFEAMEHSIEQGAMAMQNQHFEMSAKNCRRIRDILFELQSTLNFAAGGEVAKRLDGIYSFMIIEVTEAGLRQDAKRLRSLQRIVRPLIEGWKGIPEEHAHTTSLIGDAKQNIISLRG